MTFAASTSRASACRSLAGSAETSAARSTGAKRAAIVVELLRQCSAARGVLLRCDALAG